MWQFPEIDFFRIYFQSSIRWEYTVEVLDRNSKYLQSYRK